MQKKPPLDISPALFGKATLLTGTWTVIYPILIATSLAILAAVVVSLATNSHQKSTLRFATTNKVSAWTITP